MVAHYIGCYWYLMAFTTNGENNWLVANLPACMFDRSALPLIILLPVLVFLIVFLLAFLLVFFAVGVTFLLSKFKKEDRSIENSQLEYSNLASYGT